jgi:hypothetical protein
MRIKLAFGTGFAAGYLLGARAGRERYEQIVRTAKGVAENPAVQEVAGVLQVQLGEFVRTARRSVTDRVGGRSTSSPYPSTVGSRPNGHGG